MPSGRAARPVAPAQHQRHGGGQRGQGRHQDGEAQQRRLMDGLAADLPWPRSASMAKSIIMMAFFLTMPIRAPGR
jgi:hypothetical protein